MFKLLKIENARMNVPEPEYYEVTKQTMWIQDAEYNSDATTTGANGVAAPTSAGLVGATWKNYGGTASFTSYARDIKEGTAMVLSSGKLVVATGTTAPKFITVGEKKYDDENRLCAVMRIEKNMLFETETSADASSNKVGTVVTLDDNGEKVTATASSGVAEIVENNTTGANQKIIVRF